MSKKIALIALAFTLAGCQSTKSSATVDANAYGKLSHTVSARVISVRMVDVAGKTAEGAVVGGLAGAAIGANAGYKGRDIGRNVAGALIGALVGAGIEKAATDVGPAVEYVLQTENKKLFTLVQSSIPAFALDDKVLVVEGNPSRLIADPSQ